MTWQYNFRLVLSYLTFGLSIGFALAIPWMLGASIDALVTTEGDLIVPTDDLGSVRVDVVGILETSLWGAAAILLAASLLRGFFDFARTYTSDSLAQKVAYDLRNLMYDKLQHLSFAFHDKEHRQPLLQGHRRRGGHSPLRNDGDGPFH
jgi:ABC-type multidrug transport system fused ATPase/permease subunit